MSISAAADYRHEVQPERSAHQPGPLPSACTCMPPCSYRCLVLGHRRSLQHNFICSSPLCNSIRIALSLSLRFVRCFAVLCPLWVWRLYRRSVGAWLFSVVAGNTCDRKPPHTCDRKPHKKLPSVQLVTRTSFAVCVVPTGAHRDSTQSLAGTALQLQPGWGLRA